MKHYKSVELLSTFRMLLSTFSPRRNAKPHYWKHSSDGSESAAYSSLVNKKPNLTQMKQEYKYLTYAVAWIAKNFGWIKMFDFRRATVFCLRYCLLKHNMTRYSKNLDEPSPPAPLATPMYVRFIQRVCNVNALCKNVRIYVTLGPYLLYTDLFIRSFIYSEINTFGLPKFSKITFTFNIFVPITVQEVVYLKAIQKITLMDVSVTGTIDQKTYLQKFNGGFSPLSPPGSAYDNKLNTVPSPKTKEENHSS